MIRLSPALLRALAISLLAHGLLLAGVVLPEVRTRLDPPGPVISAVLLKATKSAVADVPPATAAARPAKAPPLAKVLTAASPLSAPVIAEAVVARSPQPSAAPAQHVPVSSAVSALADRVASAAPAALPSAAENQAASDAQIAYKLALSSQARLFKRYPPLARERGWEGTVGVEVRIHPQPLLPEVVLRRESGYEVLDEQALSMMRQAVARTLVPDALRQRGARVDLPVVFGLKNADE